MAAIGVVGCGGSGDPADDETAKETAEHRAASLKEVPGTAAPPPLTVPPGPPPKSVIAKDVKVGTGAEIQPRRGFTTNYIALDYESGNRVEDSWDGRSFEWCWRTGGLTKGWEIGLEGMRVGGQRELIVPSEQAYGSGARVYMVELLSVE